MKTIVKAAMLFASALVVFSSCLKEQTALSIEDIPGKAKVVGYLTLNKGIAYDGGKFSELKAPAADREVIVKVNNKSLDSHADPNSWTDYSAVTNAEGFFEVVIPAVEAGVKFKVVAPSFVDKYSQMSPEIIAGGEVLISDVDCYYGLEVERDDLMVKPGQLFAITEQFNVNFIGTTASFMDYADLKIAVGLGMPNCEVVYEGEPKVFKEFKYGGTVEAPENVDVIVKVKYADTDESGNYLFADEEGNPKVYAYGVTVENGLATFSVPCYKKTSLAEATISIDVKPFKGATDFVYYAGCHTIKNDLTDSYSVSEGVIPAEMYTYSKSQYEAPDLSLYEFDMVPMAKIIMTLDKIFTEDEGATVFVNKSVDPAVIEVNTYWGENGNSQKPAENALAYRYSWSFDDEYFKDLE